MKESYRATKSPVAELKVLMHVLILSICMMPCISALASTSTVDIEEQKQAYIAAYNRKADGNQAAIMALENFITKYPESTYVPSAYKWIGALQLALGEDHYPAAESSFQRIINDYPNHAMTPFAYYEMGKIADSRGKYDDARFWMQNLITKFPSSPSVNMAKVFLDELNQGKTIGQLGAQTRIDQEKAKAESRKKLWSNVLSGATTVAGAAAVYAEARSGGASKGDATRAAADHVSDSASGASVQNSAGEHTSSQACAEMRQSVMSAKVAPGASITASMETVMFMTKTVIDMIDRGCKTDGTTPAQIAAEREERLQQYTAAENACNAVQSGGRRCIPRNHGALQSSTTQQAQRPANTPQESVVDCDEEFRIQAMARGILSGVTYDPVRGTLRCSIRAAASPSSSPPSSSSKSGPPATGSGERQCGRVCTAN